MDDDDIKDKPDIVQDDQKAMTAVQKAREVLAKAMKAQAKPERKGGRYVQCCGIRTWVPD